MKKLYLLFILYSTFALSQCQDYDKLQVGGRYGLVSRDNYIPFEIKYKDSIYLPDIFYGMDIQMIEKYSNPILDKAKTNIVNRAGEDFYKRLFFEGLDVCYPESVNIVYENPDLYELKNYEIKYWVNYIYTNNNYKYSFSLILDKNGNVISENRFPNILNNSRFEDIRNPCEAIELVRNNKKFKNKKIDYVELAYLDEINSFCWLIKEEKIPTKIGRIEHTLDSYFVNVNSNKLEKFTVENVIGIACGIGPKEVEKKKKKKVKK